MFIKCVVVLLAIGLVAGNLQLNDKYSDVLNGKEALTKKKARQIYQEYQSPNFMKNEYRFEIFFEALKEIQQHNLGEHSWIQGINDFSDMTFEEFTNDKLSAPQTCSAASVLSLRREVNIPDQFQWNDQGVVTPVKNQGSCGSCWTFSAVGAMESHWNIKGKGKNLLFSEQQIVDCAHPYGGQGCNGGLPSIAFEYIKDHGLQLSSTYPYVAATRPCHHNASLSVGYTNGSYNVTQNNEQEVAERLVSVGPISVTFHVSAAFQRYAGGVFSERNCPSTTRDINHAVLATGYGTEKGVKFWNIKNSWGANWGIKGYFKMEKDVNMCGVAQCNAYPLIDTKIEDGLLIQ